MVVITDSNNHIKIGNIFIKKSCKSLLFAIVRIKNIKINIVINITPIYNIHLFVDSADCAIVTAALFITVEEETSFNKLVDKRFTKLDDLIPYTEMLLVFIIFIAEAFV